MLKKIGERFSFARNLLGLNQYDLAKGFGVGQSTIAKLENGKKPQVKIDMLNKAALLVDLNFIFGGESFEMKQEANGNSQSSIIQTMNNDNEITGLLKDAIKQRDKQIELLEARIKDLEG